MWLVDAPSAQILLFIEQQTVSTWMEIATLLLAHDAAKFSASLNTFGDLLKTYMF